MKKIIITIVVIVGALALIGYYYGGLLGAGIGLLLTPIVGLLIFLLFFLLVFVLAYLGIIDSVNVRRK